MSRFKQIIRKLDRDSHLLPLSRDAVSVGVRRKRVRAITCKRGRVCSEFPCPCRPELSKYQRPLDEAKLAAWVRHFDQHGDPSSLG